MCVLIIYDTQSQLWAARIPAEPVALPTGGSRRQVDQDSWPFKGFLLLFNINGPLNFVSWRKHVLVLLAEAEEMQAPLGCGLLTGTTTRPFPVRVETSQVHIGGIPEK